MKKIVAITLAIAFLFGLYIGSVPNEYSFFADDAIKSDNPTITLDVGSAKTSTATNALSAGQYTAKVKLFGFLPIKTAKINVIQNKKLVPLGTAFGVKLFTDGVIVVDITDFVSGGNVCNPAFDAGIREGDIIISYNDVKIKSNEDLIEQVNLYNGTPQIAVVKRNNLTFEAKVTPVADDSDESYRIGLWVRDSTAGIGMLTFYDKEQNILSGLGHSVSDSDTGLIMPVSTGELVYADIKGAVRGKSGAPGELVGSFLDNKTIGILTTNTGTGLNAICVCEDFLDMQEYNISLKKEIKTGDAKILCCVDGKEVKEYDIKIEKINNNLSETKNMIVKITDKELLSKTGGIVRGMSGSPIIQNGRLVGAVTHVLVDDPTRGYGIFAENMLETAQGVASDTSASREKDAS